MADVRALRGLRVALLGVAVLAVLMLATGLVPGRLPWAGVALGCLLGTAVLELQSEVLERALRRDQAVVEVLAAMGRSLETAHDTRGVGDVLLDSLASLVGCERLALFLGGEDGHELLTCRAMADAVVADFTPAPRSVLTLASAYRRPVCAAALDPATDPWLSALMPGARDLLVAPLVADGQALGVLVVELGRLPDTWALEATERLATHAALALRNAAVLEQVHELAATDWLTALANRRSFDEALARDIARAHRSDGRVSVVLIDIDHFKKLNDEHGHLVGDSVLRQVGAALREQGREYDTVARYGGEEFAVVLPGCSSSLAVQVAERFRRAIEQAATDVPVTVSCGVATYPYDAEDVRSLLSAADRGLYASKRTGRNRVTVAAEADGLLPSPQPTL